MSRISRLSSGEPSFNIYNLLYVKPNLPIIRALKNGAQTARRALSQNLFAKAWQPSNMSTNLSLQRQSHIHKLSNQAQVIFKRLSVHNLSKFFYLITRCTWPFQARFPQHTQMLIVIQGLFSQQKHAHSLSKKGTSSFSRNKILTIHIFEVQIIFSFQNTKFTSKCHTCLFCTKCKLCLLTMTIQTQSGTNTTR